MNNYEPGQGSQRNGNHRGNPNAAPRRGASTGCAPEGDARIEDAP